jgi:hypothetical protein
MTTSLESTGYKTQSSRLSPQPAVNLGIQSVDKSKAIWSLVHAAILKQTIYLMKKVYTPEVKVIVAKNPQLSEYGLRTNEAYYLNFYAQRQQSNNQIMMTDSERKMKVASLISNNGELNVDFEATTELVIQPLKDSPNPFETWSHYQFRLYSHDDYSKAFRWLPGTGR